MRRVDVAFLESILVGGQCGAASNGQQQHHPPALSSSPSSGTGFLSAWSAKQTPFEVLYTAEGFRRVRDWFGRSAGHGLERPAACWTREDAGERKKNESEDDQGCDEEEAADDGRAVECDDGYLTERQFVEILRRLADFNDTEALEVFDIFDRQTGRVEFGDFFLLLSALAARESAQMTQFLYLHGQEVFALLCDPRTNSLAFERFSKLGFFLGVPEELLLARLNEHGAHAFLPLDAEAFTLLYFDVFGALDNFRKKNKGHALATADGHLPDGGHSGKKSKDCIIS